MCRIMKLMALLLLFAGSQAAIAQNRLSRPAKTDVTIGNAVLSRDERDLVVDYQIRLGRNVRSCDVTVGMNVDGNHVKFLNERDLKGDFGKTKRSGHKQFRYNVEKDKFDISGKDVTFSLEVKDKKTVYENFFILFNMSVYPQSSYGGMLGYVRGYVGGYAKFRSDFDKVKADGLCTSSGELEEGGVLWATGSSRKTRMTGTCGLMFRAARWFYPYVGAGYGYRDVLLQDYEQRWMKVTDRSFRGVSAEAGMIFKMGPVVLSAGVSTVSFKYMDVEAGIGVAF